MVRGVGSGLPVAASAMEATGGTFELTDNLRGGTVVTLSVPGCAHPRATKLQLTEVARQLMDYGERTYPAYFPDRPVTMASAPFAYRYYPATGLYLGVVVQASPIYGPNGVYVQGGAFGPVPLRPLPPKGCTPTTAPIMLRLT